MRQALLILLGIAALTWLQFELFPGHSYLQAETQSYVPILERLDNPGFLSRDLVATNPDVTYTIYDEVTLFLHRAARVKLRTALLSQQILFRGLALLGLFLLARSTGIGPWTSLGVVTLVSFGARLSGPCLQLVDPEPVPRAFALTLTLLGAGLLAYRLPLLAGLSAGLALVYEPTIATPFWSVVLLALLFDGELRGLFRPSVTVLAVFALLLANLAQLQPAVPNAPDVFERIAPAIARIQQYRTSNIWVSSWTPRQVLFCLCVWAYGLWGVSRIWRELNRQARWFLLALPTIGVISILVSYVLLDCLRWGAMTRIQPAQTLVFLLFSLFAGTLAGVRALSERKFLHAAPFLALALLLPLTADKKVRPIQDGDMVQLSDWAQSSTWGGSMFLFPDAGRDRYPGIFRAYSQRAVWVDWQTGSQMDYFDSFADEWWRRWQDTMAGQFSAERLQRLLSLPIDYFVLKREDVLKDIKPAFATREFFVYDARDLRNAKALETRRAS